MLRKYFIPVLLVLVIIAGALYWFLGNTHRLRDARETVPVERFTLRNGLQVVVLPNDRVPAVTHILFVGAGGADDPYGKTGLAHFLEHLLFLGTEAYPHGTYDKTIRRVGGEHNAYTTYDYTAYYATVPPDALPTVMAMEADRLMNLRFDEARVTREREVITEERNSRVENSATALLAEQLNALTFLNHPYHHPLIGWAEDMKTLNSADAGAFFQRYYRASNMVLVVAGDTNLREVRNLAQRHYGNLPAGKPADRHWPDEPPLRLVRTGEMQDEKAQQPRLVRQYVAPSVVSRAKEQAIPLALLAQYLGGGSASLLYQKLVVQQKLASGIEVSYDPTSLGPSLFRIWAVPAQGVGLKQLERALDAQLNAALGTLPQSDELARAKTQLKAEMIYAQDGLSPIAHLIGSLYMLGLDEQYFYDWTAQVDAVQGNDLLSAAQAVLDPRRRVTGYLLPPEMEIDADAMPAALEEEVIPEEEAPMPEEEVQDEMDE